MSNPATKCHPERPNFGNGFCKECYHKDYYKRNKEAIDEKNRRNHKLNGEIWKETRKRYYREHAREQRNVALIGKYGLSIEDYEALYILQNGKCKICGRVWQAGGRLGLYVDHDHKTGAIRGLICLKCNPALGWYEKEAENIKNYLEGGSVCVNSKQVRQEIMSKISLTLKDFLAQRLKNGTPSTCTLIESKAMASLETLITGRRAFRKTPT